MERTMAALAVLVALSGCARIESLRYEAATKAWLAGEIADQFRECVPLGWNPVPTSHGFVIGTSIEFEPNGVWLPPAWLGYVPSRLRNRPDIAKILRVVALLESAGLVDETHRRDGTHYSLTEAAMQYYDDDNFFGNNPLRQPFLCYAKFRVVDVALSPLNASGAGTARISWEPRSTAPWAESNAAIRSVSVLLGPPVNPLIVHYARRESAYVLSSVLSARGSRLASPAWWSK